MTSSMVFRKISLWTLGVWALLSGTLILVLWPSASDPLAARSFQILLFEIGILFWILWQCSRCHISLRRLVGSVPQDPKSWLILAVAVPLIIASIGLAWLRYWLTIRFGTGVLTGWVIGRSQQLVLAESALGLVRIIILAPLVEEILFRGLFLHRWAEKWDVRTAVVTTSPVFALMHGDKMTTFVLGITLSILYLQTDSLILSMACHSLYNLSTFLHMPIADWAGLLCLLFGLYAMMLFFWRHWPTKSLMLPYYSRLRNVVIQE
jgi:membrane protease YdiL (CAAX protease family)